jgi:hypothetical protein
MESISYRKGCLRLKQTMILSIFLLFKYLFLKGDIKLTQSNAILRHIARKNGMVGKTDAEKDRINMMEHEVMDFRLGLVKIAYDPNFVSFFLKHISVKSLRTCSLSKLVRSNLSERQPLKSKGIL